MPMPTNNTRTGMPHLKDVFPARTEINKRREPINKIFSVVRLINKDYSILIKIEILNDFDGIQAGKKLIWMIQY
jgi:hypothetical protein